MRVAIDHSTIIHKAAKFLNCFRFLNSCITAIDQNLRRSYISARLCSAEVCSDLSCTNVLSGTCPGALVLHHAERRARSRATLRPLMPRLLGVLSSKHSIIFGLCRHLRALRLAAEICLVSVYPVGLSNTYIWHAISKLFAWDSLANGPLATIRTD